ncbi:hypothetical protein NHQ30_001165 [Ciborinia camelliae]|nr:hypothetical protein NHQ30_001165 [Ciborinia camelliae]
MQEAIHNNDLEFQCKRHALFMSTWGDWTILLFFIGYICGIILILLTNNLVHKESKDRWLWARWYESIWNKAEKTVVPPVDPTVIPGDVLMGGYGVGRVSEEDSPVVKDARIAEEGNLKEGESESESLGSPPPYEPSTSHAASTSTSQSQTLPSTSVAASASAVVPIPIPTKPAKKPAEQFVKGTIIFSLLVVDLFFQALAIQYFTYCNSDNRDKGQLSNGWGIFLWTLCSPLYLGAFSSFLCWVILFRDLWGPGAKKKLPLDPSCMWMFLLGLLVAAIALPIITVKGGYRGLIWCVEICQKGFCAAEEEGEELENMEEGRRIVGEEEGERVGRDRSKSRNRHPEQAEETVGLMKGFGI